MTDLSLGRHVHSTDLPHQSPTAQYNNTMGAEILIATAQVFMVQFRF